MSDDRGRVGVGGYQLAYEVAGSGNPTVVLEAGMGCASDAWDSIFARLAGFTRVVRYDRAGRGASDAAPTPRPCMDVVTDLHTLLTAATIPPPYLLVGHSFAGLTIRLFTHRYPDEVSAIVFVDAAHPDSNARFLACLPAPTPQEPQALAAARSYLGGGYGDPALNPEGLDLSGVSQQVQAAGSLGDRPIVVLTAGRFTQLPPGLPNTLIPPLQEAWSRMQRELATLSTRSTHIIAERSGHFIQMDEPELVIDAIRSVVDAKR